MKISYRTTITLILMTYGLIFIGLFYANKEFKSDLNVYNVSQQHYESKWQERQEMLDRYLNSFAPVLKALENNHDFSRFIRQNDNLDEMTNLFKTIKDAFSCVLKARYVDASGQEIIHVEGAANDNQLIMQIPTRELLPKEMSNIADTPYFQQFKALAPKQVSISDFEITQVHTKNNASSHRVLLHFGMPVYQSDEFKGVVILTVCLKNFFTLFNNTTLYNLYLLDKNNNSIIQAALNEGEFNPIQPVSEHFSADELQNILNKDHYFGGHFYSASYQHPNSPYVYKIVLDAKYQTMAEEGRFTTNIMLGIMLLTLLLTLPLALRLAKEPERLLFELDKKAHTDELTRLPNRNTLIEHLNAHPKQNILIISIDGFYEVTNLYGYKVGDELLKKFAELLINLNMQNETQPFHLKSHYFALAFECKHPHLIEEKLMLLHTTIENSSVILSNGLELNISATLGIGSLTDEFRSPTETLLEAEMALEQARKLRYPYLILSNQKAAIQKEYQTRIAMISLVRESVIQRKVIAHYQPIYNNRTGAVEKYEALMRLDCPGHGLCYPSDFMEIAKTTKHYPKMTQQMIKQVTQKLASLPNHIKISINFSLLDISHSEVVNTLISEVTRHKVAQQLIVELVETEDYTNFEEILSLAKLLQDIGCEMAIDDFGSGYANFQNIIKLRPYLSYLKIDGSIIRYLEQDETHQQMVKSIISFAESTQLKTIAEFVHDKATFKRVSDMGIDFSQGYFISQPNPDTLSAEEILKPPLR